MGRCPSAAPIISGPTVKSSDLAPYWQQCSMHGDWPKGGANSATQTAAAAGSVKQRSMTSGITSRGSAAHGTGTCKPCAWFWKSVGCSKGSDCIYCHACLQGEIKLRRKAKMASLKNAAPLTAAARAGSGTGASVAEQRDAGSGCVQEDVQQAEQDGWSAPCSQLNAAGATGTGSTDGRAGEATTPWLAGQPALPIQLESLLSEPSGNANSPPMAVAENMLVDATCGAAPLGLADSCVMAQYAASMPSSLDMACGNHHVMTMETATPSEYMSQAQIACLGLPRSPPPMTPPQIQGFDESPVPLPPQEPSGCERVPESAMEPSMSVYAESMADMAYYNLDACDPSMVDYLWQLPEQNAYDWYQCEFQMPATPEIAKPSVRELRTTPPRIVGEHAMLWRLSAGPQALDAQVLLVERCGMLNAFEVPGDLADQEVTSVIEGQWQRSSRGSSCPPRLQHCTDSAAMQDMMEIALEEILSPSHHSEPAQTPHACGSEKQFLPEGFETPCKVADASKGQIMHPRAEDNVCRTKLKVGEQRGRHVWRPVDKQKQIEASSEGACQDDIQEDLQTPESIKSRRGRYHMGRAGPRLPRTCPG
mmetsp:Transcript_751/g.1473  ORF Transcript_751/g.1473 Transcript_751/m.1473 type:complete len:592 (-) Transcript_751:122-1897(-)